MGVVAGLSLLFAIQSPAQAVAREMGVPYDPLNGYFDIAAAGRSIDEKLKGSETEITASRSGKGSRTVLAIKSEIVSGSGRAIALLDAAREKKAWDPRPATNRGTRGSFAHEIRVAAQFAVDYRAEVAFSEGKPHLATIGITDGLHAANALFTTGNFFSFLYGYLIAESVFASTDRHLAHFSLEDCDKISLSSLPLSNARQAIVQGLDAEMKWRAASFDSLASASREELADAHLEFIAGLSSSDKSRYIAEAKELHRQRIGSLAVPLGYSLPRLAEFLDTSAPLERLDPATLEQLSIPQRIVAQLSMDSFGTVPERIFTLETRIRLLQVTMAVLKFRWIQDRWPLKLVDVGPAELVNDPLLGKPYDYRLRENRFWLTAKGPKRTGDIELKSGSSASPTTKDGTWR